MKKQKRPGKVDSKTIEIIMGILSTASMPVPGDEIDRVLNNGRANHTALERLQQKGYVASRKCKDDRSYAEWWLVSREKELAFWLKL